MNFLHAILLGLIQGLTEFFPISSSAHLKITKLLLGIDSQRDFVLFDLSCHLGTLIAIIIYFKTEIVEMLCRNPRKVLPFFFATLPLIPAYFLLKPFRELASQTQYLGYCLLGTSIILYLGNRLCLSREKKEGSIQKLPDVLPGWLRHRRWRYILYYIEGNAGYLRLFWCCIWGRFCGLEMCHSFDRIYWC